MQIIPYQSIYAKAFKDLNLVWISSYFIVEEHDLEQLDHPEEIIDAGGMIFFAKNEREIAGTVALITTGQKEFELVKMAVDPEFQGKGVGKALCNHALQYAREKGANRVWLESNRKLQTALYVYFILGFKEVPIDSTPYSRADIRMEVLFT